MSKTRSTSHDAAKKHPAGLMVSVGRAMDLDESWSKSNIVVASIVNAPSTTYASSGHTIVKAKKPEMLGTWLA